MPSPLHLTLSFLLLGALVGCGGAAPDTGTTGRAETMPMRWDHRPEAGAWTAAAMQALDGPGAPLVALVPDDIATWCPAYPQAGPSGRKAFWVGLLSALAKHESTWNPAAVGGGGRWFGLVQISPATARGYGCAATSGAALQDGAANLRCAIRIWGQTVPRDGVIARGGRGIAADWGPFVMTAKREDMHQWVSAQPYCRGP